MLGSTFFFRNVKNKHNNEQRISQHNNACMELQKTSTLLLYQRKVCNGMYRHEVKLSRFHKKHLVCVKHEFVSSENTRIVQSSLQQLAKLRLATFSYISKHKYPYFLRRTCRGGVCTRARPRTRKPRRLPCAMVPHTSCPSPPLSFEQRSETEHTWWFVQNCTLSDTVTPKLRGYVTETTISKYLSFVMVTNTYIYARNDFWYSSMCISEAKLRWKAPAFSSLSSGFVISFLLPYAEQCETHKRAVW